jgi:DNA-binding IclR family transcriptional regulator
MPAETSQTLDRGLRVLTALAGSPGGLTVTELSSRLEVNRTVVYRLLATLEQHALVRRDAHARFHVGLGVLPLAAAVQPVLRDLAVPLLRELAEGVGATASWTDFHVSYRVGSRHPLALGAAGRAILLGRDPTSAPWVVTTGELQPGARGLAAPVRGVDGLEASIGIVTLAELEEAELGPRVAESAARLAAALS